MTHDEVTFKIKKFMKAYELLDTSEKWTKGAYARDANGKICESEDKNAVRFCMVGAIIKCYPVRRDMFSIPVEYNRVQTYLRDIKKTGEYPHRWNDRHTYEEVIAILKELDI